jgi:hypothetical protein
MVLAVQMKQAHQWDDTAVGVTILVSTLMVKQIAWERLSLLLRFESY